jgi:hypothetical protein
MDKDLKKFPAPLPLKKIIGPSFIILAFGLGSGELILWPYLTANYGLGLIWAALLGISFQYFINMEIERYALVKGESVFVGLAKYLRWTPYWFIVSTFVGFGLPGIIAAGSQSIMAAFGQTEFKWLAMVLLVLLGLILSFGKTVYSLMETLTKTVILLGVPFILVLAILVVDAETMQAFWRGLFGGGEGYRFLPEGISLAAFLAAFAYSGAGGNLNLTQSIYIKEKGYGMGVYSQKIAGLFKGATLDKPLKLSGEKFAINPDNISHFRGWWRRINTEHILIFWFLGFLSMALLMILSYASTFGAADNTQGISFIINQSQHVASIIGRWAGPALLAIVGLLLTQTQLGIIDSSSRIMAENIAIKKMEKSGEEKINLSRIYYFFVWAQVAFGLLMFALNFYEPRSLIIAGAVINAWAMIIHIALVAYLNRKTLPKVFRPALWRKIVMTLIFIFFLGFGLITLWSNFVGKL